MAIDAPNEQLRRAASDPTTPQAELAALAYAHPELREVIARNPAAYDGLRAWIGENPAPITIAAPSTPDAPARPRRRRRLLIAGIAAGIVVLLGGGGFATAAVLGAFDREPTVSAGGTPAGEATHGGPGEVTTAPTEPAAAPVVATPAVPEAVPVVVILDASGSMVRDVPEGGTRMEAARSAAKAFAEALPDGSEIGLTVFGTGTGNSDAEQAAGCVDIRTVIPVGALDRGAFTTAVDGIVESGFTPIGPSLRFAADQLPSDRPATIVVVSDGVDTCAPPPACDVASELRAANSQLTIHAIGFAVDADEAASEALQCVAEAAVGEYHAASNAAQLAAKLRIAADPTLTIDTVSARGLNGLRLGMTLDQAREAASGFEIRETRAGVIYVSCDDAELRFEGGTLVAIRPRAELPTIDGLTVGAPAQLAVQLYGQPIHSGSDEYGDYVDYAAAGDSRTGYRVYGNGERIEWIVVCLCGPRAAEPDADVANWVIDYDGIGPIRVGATRDEVAAFGEARSIFEQYYCPAWTLEGRGLDLIMLDATSEGGFDVPRPAMSLYTPVDMPIGKSPTTARGIGLGATYDQVRRAYPEATEATTRYGVRYFVLTNRDGNSMVFAFDPERGDSLGQILIGGIRAPWYELCA